MKATLAAILVCARLAYSATYYVSNGGNDSNNGTSSGTPWATISKVNGSSFAPGDSILLNCTSGWTENLTPPSAGTAGNVIAFDKYGSCPSALPALTGDGSNPVINEAKNYVAIRNVKVSGGGVGIQVQADSIHDVSLVGVDSGGNQLQGVLLANVFNQTSTASTNLNISSSYIHNNGGHGIHYLFRVQSSSATGNLVVGNGTIPGGTGWHGISVFGLGNGADPSLITISGNEVYGTVWTMAGGEGAGIQSDDNSSQITITANYSHDNGGYGIAAATPTHNDTITLNTVCRNGVVSVLPGIVVNNSHDNLIADNFIDYNGAGLLFFNTTSVNNTVLRNSFLNNGSIELSMGDIAAGLVSNSNQIEHDAGGTAYMVYGGNAYNLSGWKAATTQDSSSIGTAAPNCPRSSFGGTAVRGGNSYH